MKTKKRLNRVIGIFLIVVMLFTEMPPIVFAEGQEPEVKTIGFELNGADFVDGYSYPEALPIESLPTAQELSYPGYEFEGWYDNKDFTGEIQTTETVNAVEEDDVVLYAKWAERYYDITIPANVSVESKKMSVGVEGGGFYEDDQVDVTVDSKNAWSLDYAGSTIDYAVSINGAAVENQSKVATLDATEKQTSTDMDIAVGKIGDSIPAGDYTDTLTFNLSFTETQYTVKFETNGGFVYENEEDDKGEIQTVSITEKTYDAGASLSELPIALKDGFIFSAWCYDADCNELVTSEDRLTGDITLYAKYIEQAPLEETSYDITARATDVDVNYTICVNDNSGELTTEQVKAALSLKNVTTAENEPFVITKGQNNTYTISKEGGWIEGTLYKFLVDEDMVGIVSFDGYDTTIDHFDFNVYKEEVQNVSFNNDIIYIKESKFTDVKVNGSDIQSLTQSLFSIEGEETTVSSFSGTCKIPGQKLAAGDTVAVYNCDVLPNLNSIESSITTEDNDIGYLKITEVEANGTIHFKNADAEDVLFVPDVLPLDKKNEIKEGDEEVTVSIPKKFFAFSAANERDAALGLDEDTTVDIGDFIVFE